MLSISSHKISIFYTYRFLIINKKTGPRLKNRARPRFQIDIFSVTFSKFEYNLFNTQRATNNAHTIHSVKRRSYGKIRKKKVSQSFFNLTIISLIKLFYSKKS